MDTIHEDAETSTTHSKLNDTVPSLMEEQGAEEVSIPITQNEVSELSPDLSRLEKPDIVRLFISSHEQNEIQYEPVTMIRMSRISRRMLIRTVSQQPAVDASVHLLQRGDVHGRAAGRDDESPPEARERDGRAAGHHDSRGGEARDVRLHVRGDDGVASPRRRRQVGREQAVFLLEDEDEPSESAGDSEHGDRFSRCVE